MITGTATPLAQKQLAPAVVEEAARAALAGMPVLAAAYTRTRLMDPAPLDAIGEEALAELAAEGDGGDVAEAEAGAEGAVAAEDDVFDVGDGADEAGAADHGFDAGLFDAHGADIAAGGLHGHHEHVEGEALLLEARGLDVDLVFADDAAGGRDFGDAGDGAEGGDDDLVEEVAFRFEVARALEREGVDLAHGRGVGAEAGINAGRE